MYYIYILYSESKKIKYIGHSDDLTRRIEEHNSNTGGRFTKNKGPWKVVHTEEFKTRPEAMAREKYLKTGIGRDWIKKEFGI